MKRRLAFFSILIFSILLNSCSKKNSADSESGAEKDKIILGFSQIGAESAWRIRNTESVKEAAEEAGIKLLYENAEQKQENQIKAIRGFIMNQVDVIAFVPIVQDGWEAVLTEAKEAGIPVLVFDRKIRPEFAVLYSGYVGTDSNAEGKSAADFLEKKYEGMSGPFNILELRGTDGSSASDGRFEGFHGVIDSDRRFNVIYSESGDFMRSRGEEIARKILEQNGNSLKIGGRKIDIIFSFNDGMTLGFLDELERHGIETGREITVITVDAQQEAIDRFRQGKINCVVECNPDQGRLIMTLAQKLVEGKGIPSITNISEKVWTEFDEDAEIAPRGY